VRPEATASIVSRSDATGGQNSDTRPIDIELAEEAKGSEVINRMSNLDSEVPRSPASYTGIGLSC